MRKDLWDAWPASDSQAMHRSCSSERNEDFHSVNKQLPISGLLLSKYSKVQDMLAAMKHARHQVAYKNVTVTAACW